MSLAPDDGSADTDSKKLVRLKSVIRGVQTVGDGVKKTAGQKINDASGAMNSRDQRQAWMDLILSKEFDQMLDETFDKCSGINVAHDADDSLDANELAVAMEILYKRLDEMSGSQGKLPIIKESVSSILAKYDQDNNGVLDRREFRGFARTYFSRMEWPLWKTAARGAGKGVVAWVVTQTVVKPLVGKVLGIVVPLVVGFVKGQLKHLPAGKLKAYKDAWTKQMVKLNKFAKDDDGDGIPDELQRLVRKEIWAKRRQHGKTIVTFSAIFAAGSVAGLV